MIINLDEIHYTYSIPLIGFREEIGLKFKLKVFFPFPTIITLLLLSIICGGAKKNRKKQRKKANKAVNTQLNVKRP